MPIKFYDTNALLKLQSKAFEERFACSTKTLEEIEHIKESDKKDSEVKFKARQLIKLIDSNEGKYDVQIVTLNTYEVLNKFFLDPTPDNLILASAYQYSQNNEIIFVSDDLCCKAISRNVFGLHTTGVKEVDRTKYKGFMEKVMSDEEMSFFYNNSKTNIYDLNINEYLVVKDSNNNIVETYRWDGNSHLSLYKKSVKSVAFGDKIKPKDIYQSMVIDSIMNNQITAISGKAGSGKSLLSLVCAMHLIETGKYDKLVILHNPTPVRGAQQMGYYTGSAIEKAMQSNIGQVLTTKFGNRLGVDMLIQQEKLKLVSMTDCRGMEILDNEILYITEAENTSVDLMKICLSRVSSDSKVIVEGDYAQIDNPLFNNGNNGLLRIIEVLSNHDIFGYVQLQNVWRSKLAELTDLM